MVHEAQRVALGDVSRKRRQARQEIASLRGRSDGGALERVARLEKHVARLDAEEQRLEDALTHQERVQQQHDHERAHAVLTATLQQAGIRTQTVDEYSARPTPVRVEGGADEFGSTPEPAGDARRGSLRGALGALRSASHLGDELRDRVAGLVEHTMVDAEADRIAQWAAATSDRDYATAVGKLMRDPATGHRAWSTRELEAFQRAEYVAERALNLTTGQAMLPTHLDPAILLSSDGVESPVRQVARVVQIATDTWNGVSSAGVSTRWAAEATEANDDSPTLASPSIPVHKADSFVPISLEALGDMLNVEGELRRLFVDAKQTHEAVAFAAGSGTGEPTGVITALGAGQTVSTAGAFAASHVYSTVEALPARFRGNATWMAALPVLNTIDQFETANGAKLFGDLDSGRLLRKRVFEFSELDDDPTTNGQNFLLVGDFDHYVVVDRIGSSIELIAHLFGAANRPTGQRGFYHYWRVGADVVVDAAFRRLQKTA